MKQTIRLTETELKDVIHGLVEETINKSIKENFRKLHKRATRPNEDVMRKYYGILENKNKPVRIDEVTLDRIINKRRQKAQQAIRGTNRRVRTMAIISAENPMGTTMSDEYNRQAREELERQLAVGHYRYFKVKGNYEGIEDSVMIYNISIEDTLYLCCKYNQESVIFVDMQNDGEISYQYWQGDDNHSPLKLQHEEHEIVDATDDENYYTQISKKFKFRIPFFEHIQKINADLSLRESNIDVDRLITESLELNRTGKSKYLKRCQLYGKYKSSN